MDQQEFENDVQDVEEDEEEQQLYGPTPIEALEVDTLLHHLSSSIHGDKILLL